MNNIQNENIQNSQFIEFEERKNEGIMEGSFHRFKQVFNSYIKTLDGYLSS